MSIFPRPLAACLLLALFVVAGFVGGPSSEHEAALMRSLAVVRSDWPLLTGAIAGLTRLGGAPITLGVAGAASLALLLRGAPAKALILSFTVLSERLLVEELKDWIGRPRPPFGMDWMPHSLAYPSGHAANSVTAFLAIALIAVPPARRRPAAVIALLLSFLVGLSRIWLGVHWPSDVIGGWAFGAATVIIALFIGRQLGVRGLEPEHEVVGGHRLAINQDEAL